MKGSGRAFADEGPPPKSLRTLEQNLARLVSGCIMEKSGENRYVLLNDRKCHCIMKIVHASDLTVLVV